MLVDHLLASVDLEDHRVLVESLDPPEAGPLGEEDHVDERVVLPKLVEEPVLDVDRRLVDHRNLPSKSSGEKRARRGHDLVDEAGRVGPEKKKIRLGPEPGFLPLGVAARLADDGLRPLVGRHPPLDELDGLPVADGRHGRSRGRHTRLEEAPDLVGEPGHDGLSEPPFDSSIEDRARQREGDLHRRALPPLARPLAKEVRRTAPGRKGDLEVANGTRAVALRDPCPAFGVDERRAPGRARGPRAVPGGS